ncbi:MAG: ester cyclase [Alphaproteobacteria bacterium]
MTRSVSPKKKLLECFLDEVWSNGDLSNVESFIAPEYTIRHDPNDPWEKQALSIEGFKGRVEKSRAMAPDQSFSVVSMVEEGNKVAVSWTWKGTHLGDVAGIAATGKSISMSGLTIYDFVDDKLSGHWQIADRLSVYQRIGQP